MDQDQQDDKSTDSFTRQKYELDRAHELALNNFTHSLEMERLKLLLALNGGAAGLWVTFAEGSSEALEVSLLGAWTLAAPVLFWIVGAIAASIAIDFTLTAQRSFTQAYHRRRRADEWRILARRHPLETLGNILPAPPINRKPSRDLLKNWFGKTGANDRQMEPPDQAEQAYRQWSNDASEAGQRASGKIKWPVYASIATFALGAITALIYMA